MKPQVICPASFLTANLNLWSEDIGHSTPLYSMQGSNGSLVASGLDSPVYLLNGNAEVIRYVVQTRLNLSIVAILTGLAASIVLTLLSVSFCRNKAGSRLPISGSGLLHMLWLFRNQRDLHSILPPVEDPTDNNLRAAGMVPVKLVDG
ncbi:hypothetical protein C8R44DRAFT_868620 [Mycena epipterygia]|nr:hypothetical protein C8R44DRAFT_868620 [Mycena epipterygia]